MTKLNDKNDTTKKVIHLMVTSLCNRDCKYCCNKQYDLNDIPYVTDEELREAETICITGGEPFVFTKPWVMANYYKRKYPNIKKVYVYTNAAELSYHLHDSHLYDIDGLSISIKNQADVLAFDRYIKVDRRIRRMKSNRLYVFDKLYDEEPEGFTVIHREWQKEFHPAPDSIFRKV